MGNNIFVSVGKTSTPEQESFVDAIERYLVDNNLTPFTIGRTHFTSGQPLKDIETCMKDCSGTVIVAFERIYIEKGVEKRGNSNSEIIENKSLTTVWNQIEAAMAYVLEHPLLVIVERGCRKDGLLEPSYDWYVQEVELKPAILNSREFMGIFADWKRRVEQYANTKSSASNQDSKSQSNKSIDPTQLTLGQILAALKPAQLWTIGGSFLAIVTAAYKLGTLTK